MALILASGSPRRRELMSLITPEYTVITSELDETKIAADSPAQLAKALATAKARAVAEERPDDIVCGFDTVVECEGKVFGKPKDEADAVRMLRALSGREHRVHTGVCICCGRRAAATVETTIVHFSPIDEADLLAYVRTPAPTTRRAPTQFRGMQRCGVPASKGATTTLWGCRSTARHSCCGNSNNAVQPRRRGTVWEESATFLHAFSGEYTLCLPKTSALIWVPPIHWSI